MKRREPKPTNSEAIEMTNETPKQEMISRAAVRALLRKALSDQQAKHKEELDRMAAEMQALKQQAPALLDTAYNNQPQRKTEARHQTQYAILRQGVLNRELTSLGQNAIGKYLESKGNGCNNTTAANHQVLLMREGLITKKPSGRYCYKDQGSAAA